MKDKLRVLHKGNDSQIVRKPGGELAALVAPGAFFDGSRYRTKRVVTTTVDHKPGSNSYGYDPSDGVEVWRRRISRPVTSAMRSARRHI